MNVILNLIYFLLIIGLIILVHEFGHFIMAKKFNVYVYEFSIGMGPLIKSWKGKDGETTYSLRWLPLGGYCSMAGETDEDDCLPKDRQFSYLVPWKRFLVLIFGVLNNIILAFIVFFLVALIHGSPSTSPTLVDVPKDLPAYKAGLRKGDTVKYVNSNRVKTVDDLVLYMYLNGEVNNPLTFGVERNNHIDYITVEPEYVENKLEDGVESGYQYGISISSEPKKGFLRSLSYAYNTVASYGRQMKEVLGRLFTGRLSMDNLSGPVGIYELVDTSNKIGGFQSVIMLMAVISINVAYMNLLPLPVLDGGQIFLLFIEMFRGKKMSEKVYEAIYLISAFLLIALAIFVTGSDIWKIIAR